MYFPGCIISVCPCFNSVALGWYGSNYKPIFSEHHVMDQAYGHFSWDCPQVNATDGLGDAIRRHRSWSTLVQLMAWCRQASRHYLSQCWPRPISPYGVTKPQWDNKPWLVNWLIFYRRRSQIQFIERRFFFYNFHFSLKLVHRFPPGNKSASVNVMPWCISSIPFLD